MQHVIKQYVNKSDSDLMSNHLPWAVRDSLWRSDADRVAGRDDCTGDDAGQCTVDLSGKHRIAAGSLVYPAQHAGSAIPASQLRALHAVLVEAYPDIRREAKHAIEDRLLRDFHVVVDADQSYFNTFERAASDGRARSGWSHVGEPEESFTLTEMQLRNFPADYGEDPASLDAQTGIYRDGRGQDEFGAGNEVRLLSSELKQAIRENDFYPAYRAKLADYWDKHHDAQQLGVEMRAWQATQDGGLSARAVAMLRQAAGHGEPGAATLHMHVFDINTYPSKNMSWLQDADGHVVLFMPQGSQPVREFDSIDAMRRGVASLAGSPAGRDELRAGFSLYNRQDGSVYQGVDKWLEDIAGGGYDNVIASRPVTIDGNLFEHTANRLREASLDDAARIIRSNFDVSLQETLQSLSAFNQVFGNPLSQLLEVGVDLYAARTEGRMEDRRKVASDAWAAGMSAALALLIGGAAGGTAGALEGNARDGIAFRAPERLPDGRMGYVLSPIDAPRLPEPGGEHSGTRAGQPYREPPGARGDPRQDFPELQRVQPGGEARDLSATARSGRLRLPRSEFGMIERSDFGSLYRTEPFVAGQLGAEAGGFAPQRQFPGIARMIDGDAIQTFTNANAAIRSARETGLTHFRLYRIDAQGLRGVSLLDNRINNRQFASLRNTLTARVAEQESDPVLRGLQRSRVLHAADDEVHLSLEGLTPDRITNLGLITPERTALRSAANQTGT